MYKGKLTGIARGAAMLAASVSAGQAQAIETKFDVFGQNVDAVFNNTVTFGASWRVENRADDLVGKSNLNPSVCSGVYQSCQGLHRNQIYPSAHLRAAPGMASTNFDDGNLNYDRGDITQAPLKISQDFRFLFGNYGIFLRGIGIYDPANIYDFETNNPNLITAENADRVGITGDNSISNRYFNRVYGPGESVNGRRSEEERQQIGLRYDILDANFFGSVPYMDGERELVFRVGRQTVNWGQSTVAVINSVNQAQPVNANALYRLGFGLLEELYVPVGMVRMSTEVYSGITAEAYYQFEWRPIEIPTPGSYMSFVDIGTGNLRDNVAVHFGGSADDPDMVGNPLDNPLTLITPNWP